jgi:anti-sigma factor RsiW
MITCDEFFAEFGDYLEGRVPAEVRQQLELHLAQCRACHVLYDSTRKTVKIVTDSGSFDLPQKVAEPIIARLMEKLRRERDQKP